MISVVVAAAMQSAACSTTHDAGLEAAASGIKSGDAVEARGGARLRAYYVKQGEALVPTGIYRDSMREEDCSFVMTDDGFRCLPTGAATGLWPQTPAVDVFLDAACAEKGLALPDGYPPATKYARVYREAPAGACGYRVGLEEIGPSRAGSPVYLRMGGACVAWTRPPNRIHSSKPVTTTGWVRAALDRVAAGPALEVGRLRGEDGSVATYGTFDKRRNAPCSAIGDRCMPSWNAYATNVFADSTCTEHAAVWLPAWGTGETCSPVTVVSNADVCNPQYFEAREAVGAYGKDGASCAGLPTDLTRRYHRIGAPLARSAFPSIETRTKKLPGATVRQTVGASGAVLYTQLVNAAFDRPCLPERFPDGKLRCAPQADVAFLDQYSDASCTSPVIAISPNACATAPVRPVLARQPLTRPYYTTGPTKKTGVIYTRLADGTCRKDAASDYYDATPVAESSFAELTLHQEACHVDFGSCSEACTADESCGGGFCMSSVCFPKQKNGDAIPKDLAGGCTEINGRRACTSGVCDADGRCGVPLGVACASTDECRAGACIDGRCAEQRRNEGDGSAGDPSGGRGEEADRSGAGDDGRQADRAPAEATGATTDGAGDDRARARCATSTPGRNDAYGAPGAAGVALALVMLALQRRR